MGSTGLRISFVALAALIAIGFVAGVGVGAHRLEGSRDAAWRAARNAASGVSLWMGITWLAAFAGLIRVSPFPPTMMVLLVLIIVLAIGIGRSEVGRRLAFGLPLSVLVGFQSFRILVELLLHRAYVEGLMPVQMSYSGANFDIVTGVTAALLGLALAVRDQPRWLVLGWNLLGLGLLLNVLTIAVLSFPTPFRVFMNEPSNIWVTQAPWVWLPAVMVLAALLGHVLVFRRLARG